MLLALAGALQSLDTEKLRVVVIAGRGRNFCGGADAIELKSLNERTGAEFVTRIHECAKPSARFQYRSSPACTAR